jgi:predicted nucleic acid-binding protein
MVVVADTGPLNYLILIDAVDLLQPLFQEVVIPTGVLGELPASRTQEKVRNCLI